MGNTIISVCITLSLDRQLVEKVQEVTVRNKYLTYYGVAGITISILAAVMLLCARWKLE